MVLFRRYDPFHRIVTRLTQMFHMPVLSCLKNKAQTGLRSNMKTTWLTLSVSLLALSVLSTYSVAAYAKEKDHHQHLANCGHEENDNLLMRIHAGKKIQWRDKNFKRTKTERLKILGFNDFHGALEQRTLFGRPVGGAAVLAAYFAAETDESDNGAIIVHAGDHVGASPPISALLQDEPSIEFLNKVANKHCRGHLAFNHRCNVVGTLGNHEFDEGLDEMLRLVRGGNHQEGPFIGHYSGARFPYVSANVVYKNSGRYVLPPYTIKKVKGIKVAFIGAVLKQTPSIVTPTGVAGVEFLDEAEAINRLVPWLKWQGVRAMIVTIHQGARQSSFAGPTPTEPQPLDGAIGDIVNRLDDEIDIVISGHAHGFTNQLVENQNGKTILVTQAFSASTAYADIDIGLDRRTGDIVEKSSEIITTWADEGAGLNPNTEVEALVAEAAERVQPLVERVVGLAEINISRNETSAGESALGNLIADAQRSAMNTNISFMNPGGIRADLTSGEVSWGELFTIQPFANDLIQMDLNGEQILALLNQQWSGANEARPRILKTSGIQYTWDASLDPSNRIVPGSVLIEGAPLVESAIYTVTVNSFIASGGDNFTVLTDGTNRVIGPVDLDALVDYIELLEQPFSAQVEGRISRIN